MEGFNFKLGDWGLCKAELKRGVQTLALAGTCNYWTHEMKRISDSGQKYCEADPYELDFSALGLILEEVHECLLKNVTKVEELSLVERF